MLELQARIGGADPEYLPIPGRTQKCVSRWWFGNPILITNLTDNGVDVTGR
jgi:hypothetical protein